MKRKEGGERKSPIRRQKGREGDLGERIESERSESQTGGKIGNQ